ncbi:MAG: VanW family protein [Armatimonas sp.]
MSTSEPDTSNNAPTSSRGRRAAFVTLGTLMGVGVVLGGAYAYSTKIGSPDKIAPGIKLGTADLGGLTRDEALQKARTWAQTELQNAVTFTAPASGKTWKTPLGNLGGKFDLDSAITEAFSVGKDDNMFEKIYWGERERGITVTPKFDLDEKKIDEALARIAKEVNRKPKNARAKMDDKTGALVISEHAAKGLTLDEATTKKSLLKEGVESLADGAETKVVILETKAPVTDELLGKVGTVMGAFSSYYGFSSDDRCHNIAHAASKINGTILGPGEEFSYNKIVGPRDPGYGWRMGHMYVNGTVIDSLGGGVCQVSSTLYNAALFADMKITDRRCHSSRVTYLPAGRDATVVWDSQDFKFKNNTEGPIYIGAKTTGANLTFRIYGIAAPKRKIERIRVRGGSSRNGGSYYTASKIGIDENGKEFTEALGDSYYQPLKPREH